MTLRHIADGKERGLRLEQFISKVADICCTILGCDWATPAVPYRVDRAGGREIVDVC